MLPNRPPILFLNVGWMKRYAGPASDDPTRGNFGWLNQNPNRMHGHECYNFEPYNGRCWGCHPGGKGTDISNLGARGNDLSIDGVLVVWFARDPRANKAVIVGWYENATVYRSFQNHPPGQGYRLGKHDIWYKASADQADCMLLPVSMRNFHIKNRKEIKGGYGQNPNWYGLGTKFLDQVWNYVQQSKTPQIVNPKPQTKPPQNNDHENRKLVEETAIRIATEFFESSLGGSRTVESVELQAKGWDLEATGTHDTLFVEVKGLSGPDAIAELTPNEYDKMQEHKGTWVLFIVTDCLTQSPKSYDFRYMHDARRWETSDGQVLKIRPKTAAIVKLA